MAVTLALVHLVRAANDLCHLRAFLSAYRAQPAGIDHTLVLACKGFSSHQIVAISSTWSGIESRVLELPDTGLDFGTYRRACLAIDHQYVCFLNSYSRPLAPRWLSLLHRVAVRPGVGLAGSTGSLENIPHVRTNAFCMLRTRYLEYVQADPSTKQEAYALEHGPSSLTQQARKRGLSARIVNRAGREFDLVNACTSRTFRWGNQDQLLVADNQTDQFAQGAPAFRKYLQQLAWRRVEPG